jgi:hypothetical protein
VGRRGPKVRSAAGVGPLAEGLLAGPGPGTLWVIDMNELLLRTETLFRGLQTPVLLGIGAGMLVIGLVFWLGGTRYSAAIVGLLGAIIGAAAGLLVSQWLNVNAWLGLLAGAVVLASLAILLRNVLILVLAVVVFSAVSGAGYLSVLLDRAGPPAPAQAQSFAETRVEQRRTFQSFREMEPEERLSYMDDLSPQEKSFGERLKALITNTWETADPRAWAMILAAVAGAVVGIVLVWYIAKIVIALAYSLVGTALIFLGAQAALVAAGVLLVSDVASRRWLLPSTFTVMTVVGWVWQLFHAGAKRPRTEPAREREEERAD